MYPYFVPALATDYAHNSLRFYVLWNKTVGTALETGSARRPWLLWKQAVYNINRWERNHKTDAIKHNQDSLDPRLSGGG